MGCIALQSEKLSVYIDEASLAEKNNKGAIKNIFACHYPCFAH